METKNIKIKTDWIKLLTTEELKELYFNTPQIKKQILSELKTRGVELKDDKFSLPLLRSQISIQKFMKNCGFDMLISGGETSDKHHILKWSIKHERRVMEYIKNISDSKYIQLCGIELSVIESLNEVCHLSTYTGENIQPDTDLKKPLIKLLQEPVFSNELKNWRI